MPSPFDRSGIDLRARTASAATRDLPQNLLRPAADVGRRPPGRRGASSRSAAQRLTYRRAVGPRRPGRRRAARSRASQPGDRVAIRLPNGIDWVLALLGHAARRRGRVPVNTRFAAARGRVRPRRLRRRRSSSSPAPRCPTASRSSSTTARRTGPGRDLLHERHDGLPQGRDDHARELPVQRARPACAACGLDRDEPPARTLISVPLFHVTGCNCQLLCSPASPARSVIMPAFDVAAFLRGDRRRADHLAHHRAGDLLAGAAAPGLRRAPTSSVRALVATAARRSRPRWCAGSRRRSRTRASATASGSPRPRRSRPTCRTSGPPSTPTPSASPRRSSTSPSTTPTRRAASGELLIRGAERRRRLLEQAGADRRDLRRRLAAHRRPRPDRRRRAASTSSTARRT